MDKQEMSERDINRPEEVDDRGLPLPAGDAFGPTASPTDGSPLGEEVELWRGKPSQWNNLGWWLLGLLIIPLPWTIYKALRTATTNFTLTNQRLRMQTGILTRQTEEVEMYRVRDTAIRQSLFERMFGLGTLIITSSDERTPEVLMQGIPDPHGVREHFRNQTEAMRRRRGVRDIDIS